MNRPACDRVALVEAMFDGRLGPSEQASTERHLNGCASCSALLNDLTALQEMLRSSSVAVSPLEHQRARLALLRQTAGPSATARRPVALLVAVLVTLPMAVWAAASSLSPVRLWFKVPASTTQSTAVTSAIARTRGPSEPDPMASSAAPSAAPVDISALATPAMSASPASALQAASVPRRAEPRLPSSFRSSSPRHSHDASGERSAPAASTAETSQASQDFAEAMKALARGDFGASASKLDGFVSAHPRDPRVEDATYLEAIALERAGQLEGAKAAARRYLAAYPSGAHRAQARRIAGD